MSKKKFEIKVFCGAQHDNAEFPGYEATLVEVIDWLQSKLLQIPQEYRSEAKCEISSESGYEGSHQATIEITYWRKETDAEEAERLELARLSEERARALRDEKQRVLLATLGLA